MFARLFPRALDADYRGSRVALWLFGVVVAVKSLQSLMSIFNGHNIARTADGIPLDTYGSAAAAAFVALFALLGVAKLPFYALCVAALARYRSAVPLLFALLALEYLARSAALYYLPIARTSQTGGLIVNRALFAMMLVGLWLAVRPVRDAATR
jgi:hypothetical protein